MRERVFPVLPSLLLGLALISPVRVVEAEPAGAGAPAVEASGPLEASQTTVDLGDIVEGTDAIFSFTLTNTGSAALKLQAKAACGCTIVRLVPTIAPRGRAVLQGKLVTRGLSGRVTKAITVRADDPAGSKVDLKVTVNVRDLVRIEPANAAYVVVKDEGFTTAEFLLTPEPGQGVQLTEAVSSVPYLQPLLFAVPGPAGVKKLLVSVAPDAPIGHLQGTISVATSSTVIPRVNLIITGEKGISVSPGMVYWGSLSPGATTAREEILLTKNGGPFHIKSVESDDPLIAVKVEPLTEGSQYRLRVTYAGGWKTGVVRQSLTVTTDDSRQPVLKIPVQAVVASPTTASAPAPTTF